MGICVSFLLAALWCIFYYGPWKTVVLGNFNLGNDDGRKLWIPQLEAFVTLAMTHLGLLPERLKVPPSELSGCSLDNVT